MDEFGAGACVAFTRCEVVFYSLRGVAAFTHG